MENGRMIGRQRFKKGERTGQDNGVHVQAVPGLAGPGTPGGAMGLLVMVFRQVMGLHAGGHTVGDEQEAPDKEKSRPWFSGAKCVHHRNGNA